MAAFACIVISEMSKTAIIYRGKDLEAMSFAVKYHRWLLDEFRPFVGQNIVEVGAGKGSFSEMLLDLKPEALSLVEPSEMFDDLVRNISANSNGTRVSFFHSIFESAKPEILSTTKPDTIIYVNVLEHIEDDMHELRLIRDSLEAGGRCLLFVPAMRALLSEFDRDLGHFRRYRKGDLEKNVRDAGFKILRSKYFDLAGVAPWFVKYRILRSRNLGGGAVSMYDNLVVPIMRHLESIVTPPIGKNILLVAEK
jgi:SAM-dependent methyltransferase